MKDYNGFTGTERDIVSQLQKKALAAKTWSYPKVCSICKTQQGYIMFHNEDYYTPFEGYPLCINCHMRLHARFFRPNNWKQLCLDVREGKESRLYTSVYQFMKVNQDERDAQKIELEPNDTWWEQLPMKKQNLRIDKYGADYHMDFASATP